MKQTQEAVLLEEFDPEEARRVSKILADALTQAHSARTSILQETVGEAYTTRVSWYGGIPEKQALETISLNLIASSTAGVFDPLGQLRSWLSSAFDSVGNWIIGAIRSTLSGVEDAIKSAISGVVSAVSSVVNSAISGLSSLITGVTSYISSNVLPAISGIVSSVSDFITGNVLPAISGVISSISSLITGSVLPAISEVISSISSMITGSILPAITSVLTAISDLITGSILPSITSIVTTFSDLITNTVVPAITGSITSISLLLSTQLLPAITSGLTGVVDFMASHVIPAFGGAIDTLSAFLDTYVVKPIYAIASIVATGFSQLSTITMGFINAILQFPQWFPKWFYDYIGKPIFDALSQLGDWLWKAMPDWLKDALVATQKFFDNVWEGLQDFLKDPLGWITTNLWTPFVEGIQAIGDWIWQAIPDWMSGGLQAIGDFFKGAWEGLLAFFKDPLSTIRKLLDDMWKGLQWLGDKIWEGILSVGDMIVKGFSSLWDFLSSGFELFTSAILGFMFGTHSPSILEQMATAVTEVVKSTASSLISIISGLISSVIGAVTPVAETLGTLVNDTITPLLTPISTAVDTLVEPAFTTLTDKLYGGEKVSQWRELLGFGVLLSTGLVSGTLLARGIWMGLHTVATMLPPMGIGWEVVTDAQGGVHLEPVGVGGEVAERIGGKVIGTYSVDVGLTLRHLAHEIARYPDRIASSFIYGMGIWMSQPMSRLANACFRNEMVLELPPIPMMMETLRRSMPRTEEPYSFSSVLEDSIGFLRLYGHRDEVIDWLTSQETTIKITDRFETTREIPLSQMYALPSASDVATMMVKDLFFTIKDFQKLYLTRGMTKDIGALYYFLRFRYPPPEKLWEFTSRGISGLLWATATPEELTDIKKEADAIGAWEPKSPIDFNFKADRLMDAFKKYMKWHDYARFSWIEDFPSDNLIYIDTLADIPTKIDQRWMTKWALYELLISKRVGLKSPISDFRTEIIEGEATSDITMDLTLFSRTLQATGIHPDWVPLTAVAEAMNTLTEERTGLRTGFKNLFKEGFWDTKSLETLLAGAITASFQVSFFDSEKLEWGTGWVNQPVMFLPAERKLIELRALMDRAFDVLRETQRDVSKGYEEWIIDTYDEYKSKLTGIIAKINEFFSADYKEITGAELPPDLQLQFVEAYYKPYVESLDVWRDIYTVRRVRYWTQRWLGWIMYRVATGTVGKEDINSLIAYVGEKAKLTPYETEFINGVADMMHGITVREYAPTPSQLATLSGYMVISQTLIDRALEVRLIPAEWKPIWNQYISVRPIASDIKSLISTYRRALLYAVIPDEIKAKVLNYATLIGFTDREFEILALRNQLEELILDARESKKEYVPTMSMLASMSEYIPRIREFFDEVVVAKHIPPAWVPIWADYVDFRPIVDEIKKMVSRSEDLYVYFMITEADFKNVLDQVAFIGYTPKEIEYILSNARLERHHRAWTELIGDVDRMTMLAEYSPRARSFALGQLYKMIDALPIALETKAVLKEMWEQFIRLKPIMDEVRRYVTELLTIYADGLISDLDFINELEALKPWGLDDYEIMFYHAIAGMRRARKLKIKV